MRREATCECCHRNDAPPGERLCTSCAGRDELHREILADYDRRRSTRWGRFLLWLLRKTT